MDKTAEILLPVLTSIRDALAQAQDIRVNPAFVCGKLHDMLSDMIKKLEA